MTKPEPLKEKIHEVQEGYPVGRPFLYFEPSDIESAVEGLIQCNERAIDNYIKKLENLDSSILVYEQIVIDFMSWIERCYWQIQMVEHWLEDAI